MARSKIVKTVVIVSLALLAVVVLWNLHQSSRAHGIQSIELFTDQPTEIQLNKLGIARTPESMARGYMFRKTPLAKDEGLVFDYGREVTGSEKTFWMRNTYIPLGVLYLDNQLRIVDTIPEMRPHDETPQHAKQGVTWRYAVEVAPETARGARPGMLARFPPGMALN